MKKLKINQSGVGLGNTTQYLIEDGEWTPLIYADGVLADITYDYNNGVYSRVGNIVTVSCNLYITDNGTSSGSLNIAGLPYEVDHSSGITGHIDYCGSIGWSNIPLALATNVNLYVSFDSITYPGINTARILYNEGITGDQDINVNTLPNDFYIVFTGKYRCII